MPICVVCPSKKNAVGLHTHGVYVTWKGLVVKVWPNIAECLFGTSSANLGSMVFSELLITREGFPFASVDLLRCLEWRALGIHSPLRGFRVTKSTLYSKISKHGRNYTQKISQTSMQIIQLYFTVHLSDPSSTNARSLLNGASPNFGFGGGSTATSSTSPLAVPDTAFDADTELALPDLLGRIPVWIDDRSGLLSNAPIQQREPSSTGQRALEGEVPSLRNHRCRT